MPSSYKVSDYDVLERLQRLGRYLHEPESGQLTPSGLREQVLATVLNAGNSRIATEVYAIVEGIDARSRTDEPPNAAGVSISVDGIIKEYQGTITPGLKV